MPQRMPEKQGRHFFELYCSSALPAKEGEKQSKVLSIKALSFNYDKYKKGQMEVSNIMSQKAVKERYMTVKNYSVEFDVNMG